MKTTSARALEAARIRRWLGDVMRHTGLKPTPLAKGAGIAPSTLGRALDEDDPTVLTRESIAAICARYGVPNPDGVSLGAVSGGFREPDIALLDDQPPMWCGMTLQANQYVARIGSRVLDLAGLLPGDELLFDMAATPAAGDVAQVQAYAADSAETLLRLYDPPYLIARTSAPNAPKPLIADGQSVRIAAVARAVFRHLPGT